MGVKEEKEDEGGIECGQIIRVRTPFLKLSSRKFKDEDLIFASVKTHVRGGTNQRKLKKKFITFTFYAITIEICGGERGRRKLKLLTVTLSRATYSLQHRYLPP